MAVKLNYNYSFSGADFLDSRQGLATSIEELLEWDFSTMPIPLGFEVCVNGIWYTYNTKWSESTGYFKERETTTSSNPTSPNSLVIGDTIDYVEE